MTAVAAEAAVVVDNGCETSGETSLWHGAAAGAAARVDQLLRRISGLTRFDRMSGSLPLLLCSPPRLQQIAPARQIRPRRTCPAPTPFSTGHSAPAMARSGAEPFGMN